MVSETSSTCRRALSTYWMACSPVCSSSRASPRPPISERLDGVGDELDLQPGDVHILDGVLAGVLIEQGFAEAADL